jgi:arsenite oxidase small subunit
VPSALGPCACHFTTFDLTHRGMVVIGQATENLPQILLEIEGNQIFAIGTLGILYGFRDNLADAPIVEGL